MTIKYTPAQKALAEADVFEQDCSGGPGGGKTFYLITLPLYKKWIENPKFFGLYVCFADIPYWATEDWTVNLYTSMGARYHRGHRVFTWPNGARICTTLCRRHEIPHFGDHWLSMNLSYVALDVLPSEIALAHMRILAARIRANYPGEPKGRFCYNIRGKEGELGSGRIVNNPEKKSLQLSDEEWDAAIAKKVHARTGADI